MRGKAEVPPWMMRLVTATIVGAVLRRMLAAAAQRILRPRRPATPTPRRSTAAYLAFGLLAIASILLAGLTYSTSDLPASVFALAVLWYVVPLGLAHKRGDSSATQVLLEERKESLTVLLLKWLRWVVLGVTALIVSLYWIPIASLAYIAVSPVGTVSGDPESPRALAVAVSFVGGGGLALVLYPLAAGLCEGIDSVDCSHPTARRLRLIARVLRWGGRTVTTPVVGLWRTPIRAWFAMSWVLTAVIFVGAVYATQGALADRDAFEQFETAGLDGNDVAIAAAVSGVAGLDVAEWVRGLCRRAVAAASVVLAEFVGLGMVWIAIGVASDLEGTIWLFTPSVFVGALFGIWFALLLSLAQAIAAGMTALGKRRGTRPYPEHAEWCSGIYQFGLSVGAQLAHGARVRTLVNAALAARPAARPTRQVRPGELRGVLRGFAATWTGRWHLLCLASLPLTAVLGAFRPEPSGVVVLLYIPLAIMAMLGLVVSMVLLQVLIGRVPQDEDQGGGYES
jgi:hypothetical protein